MKDVLSSFLHLLKINSISYLLTTYDGKIIDKNINSSFLNQLKENSLLLRNLLLKISLKRKETNFILHRVENYIILENPIYQKIIIIDKTEVKDISITDLYFINELLNNIDESIVILDRSNKILYTNYIF